MKKTVCVCLCECVCVCVYVSSVACIACLCAMQLDSECPFTTTSYIMSCLTSQRQGAYLHIVKEKGFRLPKVCSVYNGGLGGLQAGLMESSGSSSSGLSARSPGSASTCDSLHCVSAALQAAT